MLYTTSYDLQNAHSTFNTRPHHHTRPLPLRSPHFSQHTQLLPGLTVRRASTTRVAGRVTIRFRVSDAGDPVAGAGVSLSGDRGTDVTDGNGIAQFVNPGPGTIRATATKPGYADGTTTSRCC